MRDIFIIFLLLKTVSTGQPVYKYRYETEDVMKTAASNVPLRGYHVVEGGYYPSELGGNLQPRTLRGGYGGNLQAELGGGLQPGYGGYYPVKALEPSYVLPQPIPFERPPISLIKPRINGQPLNVPISNGFTYLGDQGFGFQAPGAFRLPVGGLSPLLGGFGGYQGYGGDQLAKSFGGNQLEKSDFSELKKGSNDERFEKGQGKKGEEANQGEAGFSEKEVASKDVKGDSGYYSDVDGNKKVYQDGKEYRGGQHFNKEGQKGEEETHKQGHKKGHKIKSFKTSHHKDESGKDEEYYDEAHDEGGNFAFKGETGKFGENGASSFKGGNQEEKYASGENKKEGHHSSEHAVGESEASKGKYGGNKFAGNEASFGYKNGADEQSLLGHQETSKVFKTSPFIAPFHSY